MATTIGTPPVGGRIESERRRRDRRDLLAALDVAHRYFDRYPSSHDAECSYHAALEALLRFEERRS